MAKKKEKGIMARVGPWAFILGLIIAVLTAMIIQPNTGLLWVLGLLGLVVGLMNIIDEEVKTYLIATIASVPGRMRNRFCQRQLRHERMSARLVQHNLSALYTMGELCEKEATR